MMRGKYQSIERQGGWALSGIQTSKPIKLAKYLGFEVISLQDIRKQEREKARYAGMTPEQIAERKSIELQERKYASGVTSKTISDGEIESFFV